MQEIVQESIVDELLLHELEPGQIHRRRVHIIEDGAGFQVSLPVLIMKGRYPGPVLGVTAALHGNEINGIPAIHRLFDKVDPKKLKGSIVAVLIVNYPGFIHNRRRFPDNIDLNNIMPGNTDGNISETYAARVVEKLLIHFDYLIDLHTASTGRINSLYVRADLKDAQSGRMARRFRPQIVVHKEAADGTLRGEAARRGIPAVTIEIGNPQRFQPEYIRNTVTGIQYIMHDIEMIRKRPSVEKKTPIMCDSSYWIYTDHGGLLTVLPQLCDTVAAGDVIAQLTNIYGDVIAEYVAPEDAVIIGKSVNPVGYTGARIAHLGKVKLF